MQALEPGTRTEPGKSDLRQAEDIRIGDTGAFMWAADKWRQS